MQARAQIETLLAAGKTYEAIHIIFTLSNRFAARKNFPLAQSISHKGALALLGKGESSQGAQVASHYVAMLDKAGGVATPADIAAIKQLLDAFPPSAPVDLVSKFLSSAIAWEQKAAKAAAYKAASEKAAGAPTAEGKTPADSAASAASAASPASPTPSSASSEALYHLSANFLFKRGRFAEAHPQYLRSGTPAEHALMIIKWAERGLPEERDLFFVRAALQYLALDNAPAAARVMSLFKSKYRGDKVVSESPLVHFTEFVLEARAFPKPQAAQAFRGLQETYARALARDGELAGVVAKVGQRVFGIAAPRSFLDSLLDDLGGGGGGGGAGAAAASGGEGGGRAGAAPGGGLAGIMAALSGGAGGAGGGAAGGGSGALLAGMGGGGGVKAAGAREAATAAAAAARPPPGEDFDVD